MNNRGIGLIGWVSVWVVASVLTMSAYSGCDMVDEHDQAELVDAGAVAPIWEKQERADSFEGHKFLSEAATYQWKTGASAGLCDGGTLCKGISERGICCGVGSTLSQPWCLSTQWGPMCCKCIIPAGTGCGNGTYCNAHCSAIDPDTGECLGFH